MKDMKIEVLSRKKVEKFYTDLPHILITINDPDLEKPITPECPNRIAELNLSFWGMEEKSSNIKVFSEEDAKSILKLIQITYPYINLIVVSCDAGVSRSSGVAAALSLLLGSGETGYFHPNGPYRPNKMIYKTILDTVLDINFCIPKI